jgi:hypothetical protein
MTPKSRNSVVGQASNARQQLGNHVPAATNIDTLQQIAEKASLPR